MTFKCPDCGATLTEDSKFCKYCGAKIDDGVKRSEIRIDKRIEDVAEIKRADFEERESALRVKKMERELRQQKAKRITYLVLLAAFAITTVVGLALGPNKSGGANGIDVLGITGSVAVVIAIISQLIKGKW